MKYCSIARSCTLLVALFLMQGVRLVYAQDTAQIKQLHAQLSQKNVPDTAKINRLMELAKAYRGENKDSALKYANKAVQVCKQKKLSLLYDDVLYVKATVYYFSGDYKMSENIQMMSLKQAASTNDKQTLSKNYNLLGAIKYNEGKYVESEKYYKKKLNISIALKDTSAIIETYYNVSLIYQSIGDYETAIKYNFKILKLAQTFKDDESILLSSQGLGEAYTKVNDFAKAEYYLNKAEAKALKLKNKYLLAGIFIDRANVCLAKRQKNQAIHFYNQAISLCEQSDDKYHTAIALLGRADVYQQNGEYEMAVKTAKESVQYNKQLNRVQGMASGHRILATAYRKLKQYTDALNSSSMAIFFAKQVKSLEDVKDAYAVKYTVFEDMQNGDSAYFYYKLYTLCKDSMNTQAQFQGMARQELAYEKMKAAQLRRHESQIANNQLLRQKQVRNVFIGVAAVIGCMLIFLFKNYLTKKKANVAISKQKHIIEQKNIDILDSINYSKRIQNAILTSSEDIKIVLPESFVYFNPKDIVSGDFYFIEPVTTSDGDEWVAVALADCTGHGVPGAFMSIMAYNFLKQSLNNPAIQGPGEALDFVNKALHDFLRVDGNETALRDGMDIAFCALNKTKNMLLYAGANNPVWLVTAISNTPNVAKHEVKCLTQTHSLIELKPDKQHIGYNEKITQFKTVRVNLNSGDQLYFFTDGYADQFGGPNGKKFKYTNLQKLILEHAHAPMAKQKACIEEAFVTWKGKQEQVDDVSIIGIRIN